MPTTCFMAAGDDVTMPREPGAMWFVETYGPGGEYEAFFREHCASAEYRRDHADRAPIFVRLPDMTIWPIDQRASGAGESGWTITGEPPNLTAMPSIDSGTYHGWLKDGVLSDDLAGRTYDAP